MDVRINESTIGEVIESLEPDFLKADVHPQKHRSCERCREVELIPGSLLEIHHGPGCHEGFTELLCMNCHQRASFYQGFYPELTRNKYRTFEEKQPAIWFAIFDRLACLFPNDAWIMQQKTNLEKIHNFEKRADIQVRTLERKIWRLGCESPECEICRESDIIVLTNKAPKGLTRFMRRAMGLRRGKTILCLNCLAKLLFARTYWPEKFRWVEVRERCGMSLWSSKQTPVISLINCPQILIDVLKFQLQASQFIPWRLSGIRLPCELIV